MNRKIQVLRGLAIIAVILIHTCPGTFAGIFIRAAVNYAVALFVFCSGYLTKTEYPDTGKFYKKRLTRVWIPYVIWSLLYTFAYKIDDGIPLSTVPKSYIFNLIFGTANFSLYFVIVYTILTLLTPLIGKLLCSKYRWIGWWITPVYMILTTYIPLLTGRTLIPGIILSFLRFQWFGFYYLGMALGNHVIEYDRPMKHTVLIYLFTLLISIGEGLIWNHFGNFNMATTQARLSCLLSSSFACVLAFQYLENPRLDASGKAEKILAFIGDYSFGIYLMHVMFIGLLGRIPVYRSLPFPLNSLILLGCTLGTLVLIDRCFHGKLNRILGVR